MKKRWKWLFGLLLVPPLAWTLLVLGLRALGPTQEQARAMALLRTPPPVITRNAFPALWLMSSDVPEDELVGAAARDTKAFAALLPDQRAQFQSLAPDRYGKLVEPSADEPLCRSGATECLTTVRADPERVASALQAHAGLLRRIEALDQYDGVRSGFAPDMADPLILRPYTHVLLLTAAAAQFAKGDPVQALSQACRFADTARKLGNNSDSLVTRLTMAVWFAKASALAAEFLAEIPGDVATPESCTLAFAAPTTDDASLCEAMKHEWHFNNAIVDQLDTAPRQTDESAIAYRARRIGYFYVLDADAFQAQKATQFSTYCDADRLNALTSDPEPTVTGEAAQCPLRDWAHNFVGCVLAQMSGSAYDKYQGRLLDYAAQARLMGSVLWWRAQPENRETAQARLQRLPATFHSPSRPVELADDGHALRIRLYESGRDPFWQVPLPASRLR